MRFDQLVRILDSDDRAPVTVNDLGCGYAAMFGYLDGRLGSSLENYAGYDISEEMLRAARDKVADSRAEFVGSPVVTRDADYSFVSGTFNVKIDASEDVWARYIKDTLRYADPIVFFEFCKRELSRHVALLHDYPLYEWTMLVRTGG